MADFKKSYFDELQDHIQSGSKEELSDEATKYLDILFLLNGLNRKYGKEHAISFIQSKPFEISYRRARTMFDESINLFYSDDNIEPKAHKNMLYDRMISAAAVVLATADCPKDMEVYADIMFKAWKMKGLDQPEPQKIPEGLYKKPIKVYSLNPETIGLPQADRNELAVLIDNMEVANDDTIRLKQDAQVESIDFIQMLDDQEEKTRSES